MTDQEEREGIIEDLELSIRRLEESLVQVCNDVMEAAQAVEAAKEHHRGLITERQSIHGKLNSLRTKLEYAQDGLL